MSQDKPQWYVLNHVGTMPYHNQAQRAVDRFNRSENTDLELFAPVYVERIEKDGKVSLKRIRLAYHYVFLRGRLDDVKRLCRLDNGFSFLLNHSGTERYAIIGDEEMEQFKNIARAYENCLPYYSLEDVDLESGDLVEVVNGDFPGLIGTYLPKSKSNSGNIVLRVDRNWGAVAYNIKVSDVRVLEFSKSGTRCYDQIDAFIPHLLKALRSYRTGESLPASLKTKISVFCGRMSVLRLNNPKLDTKLQALLSVGNYLLGNMEAYGHHRSRYQKTSGSVSNSWTEALTDLIFALISEDPGLLHTGHTLVSSLTPQSKFQHTLRQEYDHYIH